MPQILVLSFKMDYYKRKKKAMVLKRIINLECSQYKF